MLAPEVIIDSIIEAYVQVDAELRIRFMNGNAERLLRRSRAEAVGKLFIEVVPDAARAHQWPQVVEAVQQDKRVDLSVFDPSPDVQEKELFTVIDGVYANGTEFHARDLHVSFDRNGDGIPEDGWFDVSYQPARDFDGKVSGVVSLSIDVTDRVRTREA